MKEFMKEFLKYVLYFGIVSLSIYCIFIFNYCAFVYVLNEHHLVSVLFFLVFLPLQYLISMELLFRLYKYDRKKNPLKNTKVLKILRFILYSLSASIIYVYSVVFYFMGLYLGKPLDVPALGTSVGYTIFLFSTVADILIIYLYTFNRITKVHKIISQEPPVEDPDSCLHQG